MAAVRQIRPPPESLQVGRKSLAQGQSALKVTISDCHQRLHLLGLLVTICRFSANVH